MHHLPTSSLYCHILRYMKHCLLLFLIYIRSAKSRYKYIWNDYMCQLHPPSRIFPDTIQSLDSWIINIWLADWSIMNYVITYNWYIVNQLNRFKPESNMNSVCTIHREEQSLKVKLKIKPIVLNWIKLKFIFSRIQMKSKGK